MMLQALKNMYPRENEKVLKAAMKILNNAVVRK